MIKSFRSTSLQAFWETSTVERIPTDWVKKIELILDLLDAAESPEAMAIPGLRFHGFAGGTKPRFAVMASKAWRISFAWKQGDAYGVNLDEIHGPGSRS